MVQKKISKNFSEIGLNFFLSMCIAVAGIFSYPFMSMLMPLCVLLLVWERGGIKGLSFRLSPPFIYLFLLLLWGGIGIMWAPAPPVAMKIFLTTSSTVLFAFFFIEILKKATPHMCLRIYGILKWAGVFLFGSILLQCCLDDFQMRILTKFKEAYIMKPTGSILGLGVFIGCGLLWTYGEKILAIAAFILVLLLIYLTRCETAVYGVVFASAAFSVSYFLPFWATRVALVASYTCLLLTPFLFCLLAPLLQTPWVLSHLSFAHRLMGWNFLAKKFFENPFVGWGLGSTPYLPEEKELITGFSHLLHPHKGSLQSYLELGAGGGILFALFFASLFWMIEKHVKDRFSIAVCNATLAFGFIQVEVTHSLWHNHWLSWIAFLSGGLMVFLKVREGQLRAQDDHSKQARGLSKE